MTDDDKLDTKPDWSRWEDDTDKSYAMRVASQAIWEVGNEVDRAGAELRDRLWALADRILDAAYPYSPPVEVDFDLNGKPQ